MMALIPIAMASRIRLPSYAIGIRQSGVSTSA